MILISHYLHREYYKCREVINNYPHLEFCTSCVLIIWEFGALLFLLLFLEQRKHGRRFCSLNRRETLFHFLFEWKPPSQVRLIAIFPPLYAWFAHGTHALFISLRCCNMYALNVLYVYMSYLFISFCLFSVSVSMYILILELSKWESGKISFQYRNWCQLHVSTPIIPRNALSLQWSLLNWNLA